MGWSYTLVPVAAEKDYLVQLRACCCLLRSSNEINPARNPSASPNHDERTYGEAPALATLGKIQQKHYCRTQLRVILFTLMKSSVMAKSFHVAGWGNFPTARDLAEPNTYMTPCHARRRKNMINQNHQSIINGQPNSHQEINSRTIL